MSTDFSVRKINGSWHYFYRGRMKDLAECSEYGAKDSSSDEVQRRCAKAIAEFRKSVDEHHLTHFTKPI